VVLRVVADEPERAAGLTPEEAYERITEHVLAMNPAAGRKRLGKFIRG
jgi:hypothetical protein